MLSRSARTTASSTSAVFVPGTTATSVSGSTRRRTASGTGRRSPRAAQEALGTAGSRGRDPPARPRPGARRRAAAARPRDSRDRGRSAAAVGRGRSRNAGQELREVLRGKPVESRRPGSHGAILVVENRVEDEVVQLPVVCPHDEAGAGFRLAAPEGIACLPCVVIARLTSSSPAATKEVTSTALQAPRRTEREDANRSDG